MVEYWEKPYDYLLGVHGAKGKGGIFARSMCIVRVQEWDKHVLPQASPPDSCLMCLEGGLG